MSHIVTIYWHEYLFSKNDEEPDDELFNIDGTYVPRTFFIGKSYFILIIQIYNTVRESSWNWREFDGGISTRVYCVFRKWLLANSNNFLTTKREVFTAKYQTVVFLVQIDNKISDYWIRRSITWNNLPLKVLFRKTLGAYHIRPIKAQNGINFNMTKITYILLS